MTMTTPNKANDLHVVLGASGGVGSAVVRELAARGRRVRGVTRSATAETPSGVEMLAGDVSRLEDARRVCAGAAVVYMCSNPPYTRWVRDFPPLLAGALAGAESAAAKLIMADNLYVYAPTDRPMTEGLPWAPVTRKGAVRKAMDESLLAAHSSGRVQVAIGRAADYYGPHGANSVIGARFFERLLTGKAVEWFGPLDLPHTLTYLDDFARGLLTLGEREEALGQVWHVPAAKPLTGRQFIALAAEVASVPAKMAAISPLLLRTLGLFSPVVREMVEMRYEFARPFLLDGTKFMQAFGFAPTPHRDALTATIAWYRASKGRREMPGTPGA
jgi:nucleoside-diphosphate-sugar epimerase